ncbi:MAG: FAD-dependent oxidoreductase, partial [Planctomycetes bacterium]|nr:FAD-dependent oxidoreductase [Planctomycetota bacterium]
MKRDPGRLAGDPFDVLVIGGGIYGAWIAYDAALRGLRTALIERDDWACATSSASSKLIHGGLRYLEYGQVALVAKALRERGRLMRLAPHRVRGLRFLLPVWRGSRTGRAALLAG